MTAQSTPTSPTAEQAFAIADRAMIDTVRAHCACVTPLHLVPIDVKGNIVMKIADADSRAVEAFAWLEARGLASVGEGKSGMSGQHIVLDLPLRLTLIREVAQTGKQMFTTVIFTAAAFAMAEKISTEVAEPA